MADPIVRRFLASNRDDDQIGGARLLAATNVTAPYKSRRLHLAARCTTLAFRGLGTAQHRPTPGSAGSTPIALRAQANPARGQHLARTRGSPAPETQAEVRTALLNALAALPRVVTSAIRAYDDRLPLRQCHHTRDLLAGAVGRFHLCPRSPAMALPRRPRPLCQGAPPFRPDDSAPDRVAWRQRRARVLATALTGRSSPSPRQIARPMLVELAASRDQACSPALLDATRVARATRPGAPRQPPRPAAGSLNSTGALAQARLNAIQLARALNAPSPPAQAQSAPFSRRSNPMRRVLPPRTRPAPSSTPVTSSSPPRSAASSSRVDARSARQAARIVVGPPGAVGTTEPSSTASCPPVRRAGATPAVMATVAPAPSSRPSSRESAFERGAVGIALAGLDTGMQFFIVTADSPHLDARYPGSGAWSRGWRSSTN